MGLPESLEIVNIFDFSFHSDITQYEFTTNSLIFLYSNTMRGGENMNEPNRTEWEIRCAFNSFCKKAGFIPLTAILSRSTLTILSAWRVKELRRSC